MAALDRQSALRSNSFATLPEVFDQTMYYRPTPQSNCDFSRPLLTETASWSKCLPLTIPLSNNISNLKFHYTQLSLPCRGTLFPTSLSIVALHKSPVQLRSFPAYQLSPCRNLLPPLSLIQVKHCKQQLYLSITST